MLEGRGWGHCPIIPQSLRVVDGSQIQFGSLCVSFMKCYRSDIALFWLLQSDPPPTAYIYNIPFHSDPKCPFSSAKKLHFGCQSKQERKF